MIAPRKISIFFWFYLINRLQMSFHNLSFLWVTIVSRIYVLGFSTFFVGIQWLNFEFWWNKGRFFLFGFFFCAQTQDARFKIDKAQFDVSKMLLCWNPEPIGLWCRFYYLLFCRPHMRHFISVDPNEIALRIRSFNRMLFDVHRGDLHSFSLIQIFAWMCSTANHLRFIPIKDTN